MAAPAFFNTPEFQSLLGAFNKFATAHSNDNVSGRALRSVLAGAKATVDQAIVEFPKSYISQTIQDVYTLITDPGVADGISAAVRSIDAPTITAGLDFIKSKLKEPATAQEIAKKAKEILKEKSNKDLSDALNGLLSSQGADKQMIAQIIFGQMAAPILDQVRDADEKDVVELLNQLVDSIPTAMIAQQLGAQTAAVTPAVVSGLAQGLVNNLPAPQKIADVTHELAAAASKSLGDASKSATTTEASNILMQFIDNAGSILMKALPQDNKPAKKAGRRYNI